MDNLSDRRSSKQIAIWLLIGVGMIIIQVLIGGITRLTESGLSITEWKPITGALPPMNEMAWQAEFDKYKLTDQFRYVHQNFSLSEFKSIFFWEWFHRLWARLMGVVFLAGFFYFLAKKKFNRKMIQPMVLLFLLGGLQGAIGWLMVKSGLVPAKYFVGHVELTTHFIAALGLLCYTMWFALNLLVDDRQKVINTSLRNSLIVIMVLLTLQLIYGGLMAGLKAAPVAATWPDINGVFVPASMIELTPWVRNVVSNTIMVHFIHRALAYLLFILVVAWWIKSGSITKTPMFKWLRNALLFLVLVQVSLGICTVLNATYANRLVFFGVAHQFVGMLLLASMIMLLYVVRGKQVT